METLSQDTDLKIKYRQDLDQIKHLPSYQRLPAESHFLLIKESEQFLKKESQRLGKKLRKMEAIDNFCEKKEINSKTFYRHRKLEREGGIKALVPNYGNRKGKGPVTAKVLPIIRQIIEPGKSYKKLHDEVVANHRH